MSAAGGRFGELGYGSFYLGTLTFGYLSTTTPNPVFQYLPSTTILPIGPRHVFYLITAVSFLGAMQTHGVMLLIFGPEGPRKNPKNSSVALRHTTGFVLKANPENLPKRPFRLFTGGMSRSTLLNTELSSVAEDFVEIWDEFTWRRVPRVLYFLPMMFSKYITWISFIILSLYVYLAGVDYASFLLLSALTILLLREWIWSPLPSYIDPEGLKKRDMPEYMQEEQTTMDRFS